MAANRCQDRAVVRRPVVDLNEHITNAVTGFVNVKKLKKKKKKKKSDKISEVGG